MDKPVAPQAKPMPPCLLDRIEIYRSLITLVAPCPKDSSRQIGTSILFLKLILDVHEADPYLFREADSNLLSPTKQMLITFLSESVFSMLCKVDAYFLYPCSGPLYLLMTHEVDPYDLHLF